MSRFVIDKKTVVVYYIFQNRSILSLITVRVPYKAVGIYISGY